MIQIEIDKSVKCNGDYSIFVTFPYSESIIEIIRSYPSRYWDKNNKQWELPLNKLGDFLEKLQSEEFIISGTYKSLEKPKPTVPKGFAFKTKPFSHQIEGFNYGLVNNRWLLGDEQGLGKTKQVIDIAVAKKLQCGYKHCLIICGVNGLKWNWVNEIHTHSDEGAWILGQRKRNGKIVIGSTADKIDDLRSLAKIDEYFIITNVESLRNADIIAEMVKLCKHGDIGLIAADEVHKMKNPSSQQGKGFLKLQAETMIAMTGTPLMNTPLDLFIILRWLGYEKHAFYAFKNHYAIMGGFGGHQIVGYKNLDELQSQLNDIMLRRLKDDVLDLPEKLHVDEYIEMTPKQSQIYMEVTNDIKAHIDEIKMTNNPLAELIRMRQATGYTGILSSSIKESAKLDRMEELVDEAVENGKKVVIFSNWTQMTLPVYNRLSTKYSGTYITGEVNSDQRQNYVTKFQEDEDCKFIVGTIGAMGTGLTLTAGTVEIFLDEPWNKALKDQAEDRCHRVGTTENITIYTLICKDTIDEKIHNLVESKGAMADAIVDGKIIADKKALLEYLVG